MDVSIPSTEACTENPQVIQEFLENLCSAMKTSAEENLPNKQFLRDTNVQDGTGLLTLHIDTPRLPGAGGSVLGALWTLPMKPGQSTLTVSGNLDKP